MYFLVALFAYVERMGMVYYDVGASWIYTRDARVAGGGLFFSPLPYSLKQSALGHGAMCSFVYSFINIAATFAALFSLPVRVISVALVYHTSVSATHCCSIMHVLLVCSRWGNI